MPDNKINQQTRQAYLGNNRFIQMDLAGQMTPEKEMQFESQYSTPAPNPAAALGQGISKLPEYF